MEYLPLYTLVPISAPLPLPSSSAKLPAISRAAADFSFTILDFTLVLCLAYIGHALRIALAVAYGILKTYDACKPQQTGP